MNNNNFGGYISKNMSSGYFPTYSNGFERSYDISPNYGPSYSNYWPYNSNGCCNDYYHSTTSVQNVFHYNNYYKEKKENGENMSFVGMRICKDGIVAWGDSKSSIIDTFGNMSLEKGRGEIRKVFKNNENKYLIATHEKNTLFYKSFSKTEFMEDWLFDHVDKAKTPYELIDDFAYNLQRDCNSQMLYSFIIGSYDKHGYFIQGVDISGNGINFSNKVYLEGGFMRNNIQGYSASFDAQVFYSGLTCSEFMEKFNNWLLSEIEANNKNCIYNPVGGPIRFETLLFEECEREKK